MSAVPGLERTLKPVFGHVGKQLFGDNPRYCWISSHAGKIWDSGVHPRVGVNYQQHLHVTCIDTDIKAVHMAYIQLSLLHVPAVVIHGNTISGECWGEWRTPAHVLGFWDVKLRRAQEADEVVDEPAAPVSATDTAVVNRPAPVPGMPSQLVLF